MSSQRRTLQRALAILAVIVALVMAAGMLLGTAPRMVPSGSSTSAPAPSVSGNQAQRDPVSGRRWVSLQQLPREASETVRSIEAGPPYPFRQDGSTFQNREELLPDQREGYYREFTVVTPGEDDRGARRIVVGAAGEYYWTADHYDSFERIRR